MAETIPRWGLPEVNFLETDAETIRSQIITGFEQASGDTLAAGDPRDRRRHHPAAHSHQPRGTAEPLELRARRIP